MFELLISTKDVWDFTSLGSSLLGFGVLGSLIYRSFLDKMRCWAFFYVVETFASRKRKQKIARIARFHINRVGEEMDWIKWDLLKPTFDDRYFSLDLRRSNITDRDLMEYLLPMKTLRFLDLSNCENLTFHGIREFEKARPDCDVQYSRKKRRHLLLTVLLFVFCFAPQVPKFFQDVEIPVSILSGFSEEKNAPPIQDDPGI